MELNLRTEDPCLTTRAVTNTIKMPQLRMADLISRNCRVVKVLIDLSVKETIRELPSVFQIFLNAKFLSDFLDRTKSERMS